MSATDPPHQRLAAIDIIRGAVMVLMAIDHVRVHSGLPTGGPLPGIFFTRWVTHFCAPAFVFLSGTSAFFYGRKHHDLSRVLLTRGVRFVLLELTVIRVAWTFSFDFANDLLAGVIWVIGWCMILLAGLVRLSEMSPWLFTNHPMGNPAAPDGYTWSLGLLYAFWAAAIVILYFACRWLAGFKARRSDWWLRSL